MRAELNRQRLRWVAGGLVVVVIILVGYVLLTYDRPRAAQPPAAQDNPLSALARRDPADALARGRPDAPVVLITYSDFRCPFCARFGARIEPELVHRYVDSGVLRIEWRDYPIFGDESIDAAKAARAAARQGRFWQFHDAVFGQAPPSGHPPMPRERLVEFAREAGVGDLDRFRADLDDPAVFADVQRDATEAAQLGVASTPTFLVNGSPLVGMQPREQFEAAIDDARAAAR